MLSLNRVLSLQARGKPQAAEREVRALLDLLSENGASVQINLLQCKCLLLKASRHLQILDPEQGEEDLIKSVAAEMAKLTSMISENSQRQ